MAEAALRLFTLSGLPMFTTSRKDQRRDFIAPTLSRRSSSISTISSTSSTSSRLSSSPRQPSSEQAEDTELQPWDYRTRGPTAQDEVERKQNELRVRRAREAERLWRDFWH